MVGVKRSQVNESGEVRGITAKAVRDLLNRLIADVYSGSVQSKVTSGVAPLLNLLMRAIEKTDIERRKVDVGNAGTDGSDPDYSSRPEIGASPVCPHISGIASCGFFVTIPDAHARIN
jgi:hypothetical protein